MALDEGNEVATKILKKPARCPRCFRDMKAGEEFAFHLKSGTNFRTRSNVPDRYMPSCVDPLCGARKSAIEYAEQHKIDSEAAIKSTLSLLVDNGYDADFVAQVETIMRTQAAAERNTRLNAFGILNLS